MGPGELAEPREGKGGQYSWGEGCDGLRLSCVRTVADATVRALTLRCRPDMISERGCDRGYGRDLTVCCDEPVAETMTGR